MITGNVTPPLRSQILGVGLEGVEEIAELECNRRMCARVRVCCGYASSDISIPRVDRAQHKLRSKLCGGG